MAPYTISDYLFDRVAELGVDRIFGVPGDFTLTLLDHVLDHPRLSWVGCTNELNAGYAADGYGRIRGIGALMTTFGVGELSAINAVAGSFAEHVPVIHIVGAPSTSSQTAQRMVHHSLGDGVFTHFIQMHVDVTCAHAALTPANAIGEIDRVLVAVRDGRQPGYLLLPSDVGETAAAPPMHPLPARRDITDPVALTAFTDAAQRLLAAAADSSEVSVLAGLLVHRFNAVDALSSLLATGTPHATSAWSKSLVDESNPAFLGLYAGGVSSEPVRMTIEQAPALIVAGVQFTDLNSGFFTHQIPRERTIELGADEASVASATFSPVSIDAALRALADIIASKPRAKWTAESPSPPRTTASTASTASTAAEPLSQVSLWQHVAEFLRPGDIVVADQGTSFYGMATQRLAPSVTFIGQPLWASIGYSVPASLGAVLAGDGRRGVLLVGDGAAQMTVQELSTALRLNLPVTVVVVDNDGYTVERAIHGAQRAYNDIAAWDWTALPAAFSPLSPTLRAKVATTADLVDALAAANRTPDRFTLIQAVVPRMDVPELLSRLAAAAGAANTPRAPVPELTSE